MAQEGAPENFEIASDIVKSEPAYSPPPGMPAAAAAPKGSKPKPKGSKPKRKASAAEAEAANMSAIADYVHELEPEGPLPTGEAYEAAMAAARSAFVGNWRCWWCGCRKWREAARSTSPSGRASWRSRCQGCTRVFASRFQSTRQWTTMKRRRGLTRSSARSSSSCPQSRDTMRI